MAKKVNVLFVKNKFLVNGERVSQVPAETSATTDVGRRNKNRLECALNKNHKNFPIPKVLQEMLDHIDRQQRNKLKLDNLSIPSPERHRPLRHQFSSDNMHVPPFNIPNLRIDQRKTSSAEDMARKNSTGKLLQTAFAYIMQHKFYIFILSMEFWKINFCI